MKDLIEKLTRNARFYRNEAVALAEKPERRDNRHLGAEEAQTISELLSEAARELEFRGDLAYDSDDDRE